jgi:Ca-activated chloride channel family protein
MQSNNARERDVERRLGRVESPEPPADLLDRIRGDLPEHLRPVDEAPIRSTSRSRGYRLIAASLFLAVLGGVLAYRVLQTAPAPASVAELRPDGLAETEPQMVTTEVGDETQPAPGRVPVEVHIPPEMTLGPAGDTRSLPDAPLPEASVPAQPEPAAAAEALASPREGQVSSPEETRVAEQIPPAPTARQLTAPERSAPLDEKLSLRQRHKAVGPESMPKIRDQTSMEAPGREPDVTVGAAASGRVRITGERQTESRRYSERMPTPMPRPMPTPDPGAAPSTGGTAEPNDQPWGDMFFRSYGTNPFVDTEDDAQSTFGLDVDTGSYTLARSYLERGHLPPPEAIRVEEFLNFFDYRDPAPRRGEFTLSAEGAPSPWARGPRYQLLRVGVRGREIAAAHRRDATLIFVVDVSGSMARDNRIGLVQRALHLLLDQLRSSDQVGLVVYGSRGQVLLEPSNDHSAVRRAIDRLTTGGSTNAEEGLLLGYELARRHYRPESINRLVLCSDGVANVGRTGPESILDRIGREAEDGIELTTVGFGMGNYNDVLMEQLADRGDGNYAYVDTLEEARRVFVENLTGTLQTIAADAKIQVEFDPRVVSRYRLLGYENRDVADHRFRDDTVDAGEIGAGHRVTALYEIKLAEDATRKSALAEVRLRYRSRATGRVVEESLAVRRSDLARSWRAASPSLRLAALAAELAEVLKRSYWARETRPEELRERARQVDRELGDDHDAAELVRLTRRAIDLVDWPEAAPE